MLFGEIIKNTGINLEDYPKSSNIEIHLYDGKERISNEKTISFVKPLFEEREASLQNFKNFLAGLEQEDVSSMNVKVDIDSVILFYKSPRAIIFLRNPSLDTMDYMG